MTDTPHDSEEDEISLLDLLQTLVENLRLLVLVPLLLGLAALGWRQFVAKNLRKHGPSCRRRDHRQSDAELSCT